MIIMTCQMATKFDFQIKSIDYAIIGNLWFEFNGKRYDFSFNIHSPDCDQDTHVNAYYFFLQTTNEYGAKLNYVEYANCFHELASRLDSDDYMRLFYLDINNEFKDANHNELKELFLKINRCVLRKVKKYYNIQ